MIFMKKIFVYLIVIITILNMSNIPVYAKELTWNDLAEMSDYDYYCTFAEALKSHDSYTLSLFIDCCSKYHGLKRDGQFERLKTCAEAGCTAYKQFDNLKEIKISSYSVKIIGKSDTMFRPAAKITLNISKGDNKLFPKGKTEYYVLLDRNSGMNGEFVFKLYNQKSVNYEKKYLNIILGSVLIAGPLNNYESMSEKQLKSTSYNAGTIHMLYHSVFESSDEGITESELNSNLQFFFNSDNTIEKNVLKELPQNNDMYFYMCGHGGAFPKYQCNKITRNKKTELYTFDIWFYSDAAKINVCRKIKFTYKISDGKYTIKKIDCYYSNDYDVISLG